MARKKLNRKRTKNNRKNQKGGGFFDFFKSKTDEQTTPTSPPQETLETIKPYILSNGNLSVAKDDSKCIEYTNKTTGLVQEYNKIKEDINSKNINCSTYKPSFWSFNNPCDKLKKNISAINSNFTNVNNSCNYQDVNEVREIVRSLGVMVGGKRKGKKTRRHKRKKHHRTKKNKSHRKK
jgi:hypothetical protein